MNRKKNGKRLKDLDIDEILNVLQEDWKRVELTGGAIPDLLGNLTSKKKCRVYASGAVGPEYANYDEELDMPVAAGMRVIRDARGEPEGVNWNTDDYIIFRNNATGQQFMAAGPFIPKKDHHTDDIPNGFEYLDIFKFKYPECPKCGSILNREYHYCENCGWNQP